MRDRQERQLKSSQDVLAEAAAHYYVAMLLCEDEDVDPDDHLEVVRRAFSSADCDDFL